MSQEASNATATTNPPKSALLVIDIQESFRADPESWAERSNSSFEKNVTRLIAKFRQSGEPIIFVLHQNWTPGSPFHPDSPHCRFMDWIRPERNDIVLRKTTRSVFASTELARRLTQLGVTRLIITGIQTEQCCETTTRDAGGRGYQVDFVTDATLTFPIKHWAGGPDLPVEEIIRRTEYALAGRFARISQTQELLASYSHSH
jgi:nicotinamidase-related amidase